MKQELTHNEILFRVLLQREMVRPSLTFAALEEVIPKSIRKSIATDWRSYIRDEGLEFDTAFQKAIRKHIPGLHFIVLAAEFLGKIPFHIALGHFLQPEKFKWTSTTILEGDVFSLADRLEEEFRITRAKVVRQQQRPITSPKIAPTATGPTRKCYFCRKQIPADKLYQHVDLEHLNPPKMASAPTVRAASPQPACKQPISELPVTSLPKYDATPTEFLHFNIPRCACGSIAIPGDFYCYHCAPD